MVTDINKIHSVGHHWGFVEHYFQVSFRRGSASQQGSIIICVIDKYVLYICTSSSPCITAFRSWVHLQFFNNQNCVLKYLFITREHLHLTCFTGQRTIYILNLITNIYRSYQQCNAVNLEFIIYINCPPIPLFFHYLLHTRTLALSGSFLTDTTY